MTDTSISRGGFVHMSYIDSDPDGTAMTQLFADVDGDADTLDDRYPMSELNADGNF